MAIRCSHKTHPYSFAFQFILEIRNTKKAKVAGKQLHQHTDFISVLCFVISLWRLSSLLCELEKWTALKEQGNINELRNAMLLSMVNEIWEVNLLLSCLLQYSLPCLSSTFSSGTCGSAGTSRVTHTSQTLMLPSGMHLPHLCSTEKTGPYSEKLVFPLFWAFTAQFQSLHCCLGTYKWLESPFCQPSSSVWWGQSLQAPTPSCLFLLVKALPVGSHGADLPVSLFSRLVMG